MVKGQQKSYWKANQKEGGGKKGIPRLRWMENVELDLRNMYVANREHELSTKVNGHFS
jgi:hypothetical protein